MNKKYTINTGAEAAAPTAIAAVAVADIALAPDGSASQTGFLASPLYEVLEIH